MEPDTSGAPDSPQAPRDLVARLSSKVVGQPDALRYIAPYVQMHEAGLSPADRPVGIFLLLGPTGTGKTRTVEALAEILHGSAKHLLKIDCAEYQHDHEIAKLIGAPPGYIGHRETKPLLTQQRLLEVVSPACDLAIVLFDEIEKASPALTQLLLGVLDKATLRVGDNTTVNFEQTLVFLTSNLGAPQMLREIRPDIGFQSGAAVRSQADMSSRLESIALSAVRKRFSPEFVNRIDVVITYRPLDETALAEILDHQIVDLQRHVRSRLGDRSFEIEVTSEARQLLLSKGASPEYGARELKRTLHRMLTQPLAAVVAGGGIQPGERVVVDLAGDTLSIRAEGLPAVAEPDKPVVLLLDDNASLLEWLREAVGTTVTPLTAATVQEAREVASRSRIDLAVVDMLLPDGDGLTIALELLRRSPRLHVVVMSGMGLSDDEQALCERQEFSVLRKPFLADDLTRLIEAMFHRSSAAGR
jgi:ATP-dependent Clp protease ATP-binding subunit ClpA/CheY-like chemotaxis protein